MKVVVTGANGFLGSWVLKALEKQGCEVLALIRKGSDQSEIKDFGGQIFEGDILDIDSLNRAFAGADSVFHLAGVIAYKKSERSLMERVNVGGTANVITAARLAKIRRLVHLSSVTAVGAGFSFHEILNEYSPFNVEHLHLGYFDTKRQAEILVKGAAQRGDFEAVILNPSTIYGPGDSRKSSRKTQLKVARGEFPFYTGGGVSIVAIEDAVRGILAAWQKGRSGERYILSGENITIQKLLTTIAEIANVPPPKWKIPNAALFTIGAIGDLKEHLGLKTSISIENAWTSTLYHWFDHGKATRELDFNPRPARAALEESVLWMKQNGLLNPR